MIGTLTAILCSRIRTLLEHSDDDLENDPRP